MLFLTSDFGFKNTSFGELERPPLDLGSKNELFGTIGIVSWFWLRSTTSKYLQQRVAPVGDYHGMDVELLLTETGRLIGFCDYLLISWGNQHWSTAISMILSGDTGFKLGVIPWNKPAHSHGLHLTLRNNKIIMERKNWITLCLEWAGP